jgi:bifunctional DNase/RNase
MEKIKLNILGLTAAKGAQQAYALILEEEGGPRRLPIIIGAPEAQAIAIALEDIQPPRPLTHNLFKTFMDIVDAQVTEIYIYKMEKGVFFAEITFNVNDAPVVLDARPSDAIALAVQFKAPIFINKEIMDDVGIDFNKKTAEKKTASTTDTAEELTTEEPADDASDLSSYSDEDLYELMQMAINEENYELAARLRDELNKRKES